MLQLRLKQLVQEAKCCNCNANVIIAVATKFFNGVEIGCNCNILHLKTEKLRAFPRSDSQLSGRVQHWGEGDPGSSLTHVNFFYFQFSDALPAQSRCNCNSPKKIVIWRHLLLSLSKEIFLYWNFNANVVIAVATNFSREQKLVAIVTFFT